MRAALWQEHQVADWKDFHKHLCPQARVCVLVIVLEVIYELLQTAVQMDTLTKLVQTVGSPFKGHLNFRFEVEQVSVNERQAQADAAFSEFVARHGIPSHSRALQPQLDMIMAQMALLDWESERQGLDLRTGFGALGYNDDADKTFADTPVGRMLVESSRRAGFSCQHSITDVDLDKTGESVASVASVWYVERLLVHLPRWSCDASSRIDWYIQIDHPTMHKRHLEAAPGWSVILEDQGAIEQLVLRHTSGAMAAFSDEPGFLASIARESCSAFPVLVLQPHINRADETRSIVERNATVPRLFTAWFRVNSVGTAFKVGPGAALRYGLGGDRKDSPRDIVKALTNCEDHCTALLSTLIRGRFTMLNRPDASSSSSSDEDRHRVAAAGVQPELEPRMDWRSKRACRYLKTARGCRNSNCPFKH